MSENEGPDPSDPGPSDLALGTTAGESDASAFDGLPQPVARALAKRGFVQLTSVQRAVASADTSSTDLRISSQTGSGKTVAVGIAIARTILADGPRPDSMRGPSVLVLAPTRELAGQVRKELDWLLAPLPDSTTEVVTGGTSVGLDRKNLARRPRVLVGTPGRVLDHLGAGVLRPEGVSLVVLDEADQMLDMGFREELESILGLLPSERRTHLVSATFSGEVLAVAKRVQKESMHLEGSPLGSANTDIEHIAHVVPERHRYDALVNLLLLHQGSQEPDAPSRVLVFTRTRRDTAEVAERLAREGFKAEPLSGDLAQASRTRTLEAFRHGRIGIIVATDVAARGLDVDGVSLVVHFDPPGDADALTHRSGRTGRAGQKGTSVLLLPPQARRRIERLLATARIAPTFAPVPSAEKIQKAFTKAGRRLIFAAIEQGQSEENLAYAAKLLAEHPAEKVIATLLGLTDQKPPCAPRDVSFHLTVDAPRGPRLAPGRHARGPGGGAGRGPAGKGYAGSAYSGSAYSGSAYSGSAYSGSAYSGSGSGHGPRNGAPAASAARNGEPRDQEQREHRPSLNKGGLAGARYSHARPYPRDVAQGARPPQGERGSAPRPARGKAPPFGGGKPRKPGLGRP